MQELNVESSVGRIVSLAQNVPGPVAVARLVARGARAIKIEPPAGDPLASLCQPWYDELHAGVEVQRLDLKSGAGMAAMLAHLQTCDLLIASQRPAALARLGLDAATVTSRFPHLRHLDIVGDTAHPAHPGHDLTYQAQAGLLDGMPRTLVADLVGAERAYAAAVDLLHGPPGRHAVIGLADAVRDLAAPLRYGLTTPGGPLGGGDPIYRLYAAQKGRVAVAALEPHFRRKLYDSLGAPDGSDLSACFLTKTADEWETWAQARDLPVVAVQPPAGIDKED